jgi:hypothetical protein
VFSLEATTLSSRTESDWATVENWAADRNVMFRMEDTIKPTEKTFA